MSTINVIKMICKQITALEDYLLEEKSKTPEEQNIKLIKEKEYIIEKIDDFVGKIFNIL